MPILLEDRDISSEFVGVSSALVIPCRFCPAANLALRESSPYIQPFRHLMRTSSYHSYIGRLQERLERSGIKTDILDSRLPNQFILCMWTSRRRAELAKRSASYDAVIVLGCEAAVDTARSAVNCENVRVVSGMETRGIMNVVPALKRPFDIWLQVNSVTTVLEGAGSDRPSTPKTS